MTHLKLDLLTNLINSIKLTSIHNQQLRINEFIILSKQKLEELKLFKFEKYGIVFDNLTKYYKMPTTKYK